MFGLGGWAATTQFAGAVVAPGTLVVESDVKKVQHPTGGIVGRLMVREGEHVKAGDLLVQLDETTTRANLLIITDSLDEQTARERGSKRNATTTPRSTFSAFTRTQQRAEDRPPGDGRTEVVRIQTAQRGRTEIAVARTSPAVA